MSKYGSRYLFWHVLHVQKSFEEKNLSSLAQGQGRRVLGVGPPDLDDVVKLLGLGLKSVVKLPEMLTMSQFYRVWITDKFSKEVSNLDNFPEATSHCRSY